MFEFRNSSETLHPRPTAKGEISDADQFKLVKWVEFYSPILCYMYFNIFCLNNNISNKSFEFNGVSLGLKF